MSICPEIETNIKMIKIAASAVNTMNSI